MSARKILGGGAAAAVLLAGGVLAGTSIAGNDGESRATSDVVVAEPLVAAPVNRAADPAAKGKKRKKPTVRYFQASVATVPPEGGGIVQPITCPPGQGEPIAAGAQTTVGLVVNYLSRINPETQELPPQTYYVGVEDISDTNQAGSGALVEVQCAKNIKVDYGQPR
jgi:hypothetical protein